MFYKRRVAHSPVSTTAYQSVAYAPYGEDYAKSGQAYDLSFTGHTADGISVTYNFMFRDYSAIYGRWYSPDPAGLSAVDPTNPQTWNRYAYVGDNPMTATGKPGKTWGQTGCSPRF